MIVMDLHNLPHDILLLIFEVHELFCLLCFQPFG